MGAYFRHRAGMQLTGGLCAALHQVGAGQQFIYTIADVRQTERGQAADLVIAHADVQIIVQNTAPRSFIPSYYTKNCSIKQEKDRLFSRSFCIS
jgi:hypothetical protein